MILRAFLLILLLIPISAFTQLSSIVLPKSPTFLSDSADLHVGDELSSLPASIQRYNATRHRPDAKPSDDFNSYAKLLCKNPSFKCVVVTKNQTWASIARNGHQREILMRLNRTNVALKYRKWIVIPKNIYGVRYMNLSPMPKKVKATGNRQLIINLCVFAFGAYDQEGNLVYWGPASGGKKYCADTKENCESAAGSYRIFLIKGEDCVSRTYPLDMKGGAPMPYCMYYHKGFAIHSSTLSGFINRSRGCIRLFYNDAKWLNKEFVKLGTHVIVIR